MDTVPFGSTRGLARLTQAASLAVAPAVVLYWALFMGLVDGRWGRTDVAWVAPLLGIAPLGLGACAFAWARRTSRHLLARGARLTETNIWGQSLFRGTTSEGSYQQRLVEMYTQAAVAPGALGDEDAQEVGRRRVRTMQILFGASTVAAMAAFVTSIVVPHITWLPYVAISVAGLLCLVTAALFARFVGEIQAGVEQEAAEEDAEGQWARQLSSPVAAPVPRSTVGDAASAPVER